MDTAADVKTADDAARANLYGLFARLYCAEPTPDFLRAIQSPELQGALAEAEFDRPDPANDIHGLAVEFTRLFLGPGPHVSPHESVFAPEGQLWGPEAAAVKRFIEFAGLRIDDETFMPDHVSMEMEVMRKLVEREAAARAAGDVETAEELVEAERFFLVEHLGGWFPAFAERVQAQAALPFYREWTALAKRFICSEVSELTAEPRPVEGAEI